MVQSLGRGQRRSRGGSSMGGGRVKIIPTGEQRALWWSIRRESSRGSKCFWLQGTLTHRPKPSGKKKNPRPKQERGFE